MSIATLDAAAAVAEDAALAGEVVDAARLADAVLADPAAPLAEQARAATVLAAVLAHRGLLAQSAELHTWVAAVAPAVATPAAAIALVGTGSVPATGPAPLAVPTLRAGADALLARGLAASVRPGASASALSDLTRAVGTLQCRGAAVLADESPAVLAALVALHRGEPDLARPLLDRAVADDLGGPAFRRRHLLWRAWTAMAAGDPATARAGLDEAAARPEPSQARDELVAVGLEAGLARRAGDTRALLALWSRAREAALHHAVDLWSLLPFGELYVVAARLGEAAWLATHVADADALLAALGRPVLWAAPWHWHGFVAAVTATGPVDAETARAHAARLDEAAAGEGGVARILADAAARWVDVLAGRVDADAVALCAGRLRDVGLPWDGARLAKEAAVRTTDRKAIGALLGCARSVLPATPAPEAPETPAPQAPLSDREREVARLLLEGMTYRQIGDRLFITAKTVEHHVGRMRQRLGSETRTDLFADLRSCMS